MVNFSACPSLLWWSAYYAGLVRLTADTFMEALLKVCCDVEQCHMYHPHPLMLLIAALNKGETTLTTLSCNAYMLVCHALNYD